MKKINLSPGAKKGILFLNGFAAVGSVFLTLLQLFTNGAAGEIQTEETLEMLDQRYERKALPEKTEDEDQEEES